MTTNREHASGYHLLIFSRLHGKTFLAIRYLRSPLAAEMEIKKTNRADWLRAKDLVPERMRLIRDGPESQCGHFNGRVTVHDMFS